MKNECVKINVYGRNTHIYFHIYMSVYVGSRERMEKIVFIKFDLNGIANYSTFLIFSVIKIIWEYYVHIIEQK